MVERFREPTKEPMPERIRPMSLTEETSMVERPGWYCEIKWDGWRAISHIEGGRIRLYSKRGSSLIDRFPRVVEDLKSIGGQVILDGEIVALDQEGMPQRNWLAQPDRLRRGATIYQVFDVLHADGFNLMGTPLRDRREALAEIIPQDMPHVRIVDYVRDETGAGATGFLIAVKDRGLEGTVLKDPASLYVPDKRTRKWIKLKQRPQTSTHPTNST